MAVVTESDSAIPKLRLFMTEEFTNRVLTITQALPLALSLSQTPKIVFHASMPAGFDFDQTMLFFEQRKPLTPDQAFSVNHYSFPNVFTLFLPQLPPGSNYTAQTYQMYPDLQTSATVDGRDLTLPLVFDKGAGVYTMVVWLKAAGQTAQQVTARSIFAIQ